MLVKDLHYFKTEEARNKKYAAAFVVWDVT